MTSNGGNVCFLRVDRSNMVIWFNSRVALGRKFTFFRLLCFIVCYNHHDHLNFQEFLTYSYIIILYQFIKLL